LDQDELLRRVVGSLEAVGLRYLVTGSIATSLYGEPRFTNDIDVVVDLPLDRLEEFLRQFPTDEFYLSEESARRAVERRTQFNVIHPRSGLKVDVMVAADDAFDESRFARGRRLHPAPDYRATFAAPEDVIVKKMEYYRAGGSDRHLRDIAGVLEVSGKEIDRDYIGDWAGRLGLSEIWRRVLEGLKP
jgi:hypothetical protein